jgi:NAD dependent epimerase/dehydratase family enzyme
MQSRVSSTRVVGQAIAAATCKPRLWLQASTATIYAHRYESPNDEHSGILAGDEPNAPDSWRFSIDVARRGSAPSKKPLSMELGKVALRSAMTLSPDPGGVFDTLLALARRGLGGSAGDGRQFMSWIHHEDFIAAVRWLIDRDDIEGVVNVAAPNPLPIEWTDATWNPVRGCTKVSPGYPSVGFLLSYAEGRATYIVP